VPAAVCDASGDASLMVEVYGRAAMGMESTYGQLVVQAGPGQRGGTSW
jgi:hypothetical protein